MKLQELKAAVYKLAGVSTTRQLKVQHPKIRTLDLRRKAAWQQALTSLQSGASTFETWLEHPPEEYQTLFAEIEQATQQYDQSLAKTEQLTKEVIAVADQLDELAAETQAEASELKQQVKVARRIAQQAELN